MTEGEFQFQPRPKPLHASCGGDGRSRSPLSCLSGFGKNSGSHSSILSKRYVLYVLKKESTGDLKGGGSLFQESSLVPPSGSAC